MNSEFGTIAVLGCGNMGGALIRGLAKEVPPNQLCVFDVDSAKARAIEQALGIRLASDILGAVRSVSTIVLAVKPNIIEKVLSQIREGFSEKKLCISVAAGVPLSQYEAGLPAGTAVIRAMPNMGAQVGVGATGLALGRDVREPDRRMAFRIFESVGLVVELEEKHMDALTALSGSGPAFVLLVLEALAEAGVEQGLETGLAHKLAAQTLKGAGELFLRTGESPKALRDRVTSKGGTTAAGLEAFKDGSVAKIFREAVRLATERSRELGKSS